MDDVQDLINWDRFVIDELVEGDQDVVRVEKIIKRSRRAESLRVSTIGSLCPECIEGIFSFISSSFPQLKRLAFFGNFDGLTIDHLGMLPQLKFFELRHCDIPWKYDYPERSSKCVATILSLPPNLKRLMFTNFKFAEIPKAVYSLKNLKSLYLLKSHIESLSFPLRNMKSLEFVIVELKDVSYVSPEILKSSRFLLGSNIKNRNGIMDNVVSFSTFEEFLIRFSRDHYNLLELTDPDYLIEKLKQDIIIESDHAEWSYILKIADSVLIALEEHENQAIQKFVRETSEARVRANPSLIKEDLSLVF